MEPNTLIKRKPVLYEFAVQKITLNNGKQIMRPVVRIKHTGWMRWVFPNAWERISCIYGRYIVMDLPFEPDLTEAQCGEHIINYKNVLNAEVANNIKEEDYTQQEEQTF